LKVIAPFGHARGDSSWIAETSLDVEWAHALAPDAAINLVVAKSSDDVDLYNVIKYVVEHNLGDVLSLSFGENEQCIDTKLRVAEHEMLDKAVQEGMTVLVASGDSGSAQFTCDNKSYVEEVSYPASDPLVTAVGGTMLSANATTGAYQSESAWNEADPYNKAGGGGFSGLYTQPDYQANLMGGKISGRGIPDISLNASVNGGALIYQTDQNTGRLIMTIMGGTSVGTPEMAALIADGVQMAHHRLGQINPALYKIGSGSDYHTLMNDVTSGDNILAVANVPGYNAGPGWDAATGWGSPRQAYAFLQALIATT
jgi:subtilase family serine protease